MILLRLAVLGLALVAFGCARPVPEVFLLRVRTPERISFESLQAFETRAACESKRVWWLGQWFRKEETGLGLMAVGFVVSQCQQVAGFR